MTLIHITKVELTYFSVTERINGLKEVCVYLFVYATDRKVLPKKRVDSKMTNDSDE